MKKKKPDNVVYNEETEKYEASILPYATNVGAPSIQKNDLSNWKNNGINKVNHHLKSKFDELKAEYERMLEQYKWNDIVYGAKFSFEPVIGEVYHLYMGKDEQLFLSTISPEEWKKEHIGSFRLNANQIWEKV